MVDGHSRQCAYKGFEKFHFITKIVWIRIFLYLSINVSTNPIKHLTSILIELILHWFYPGFHFNFLHRCSNWVRTSGVLTQKQIWLLISNQNKISTGIYTGKITLEFLSNQKWSVQSKQTQCVCVPTKLIWQFSTFLNTCFGQI